MALHRLFQRILAQAGNRFRGLLFRNNRSNSRNRDCSLASRSALICSMLVSLSFGQEKTTSLPASAARPSNAAKTTSSSQSNAPPQLADVEFLTGRSFDDALQKPLSLVWREQPLRAGLHKLMETQHVAILLDRRIDPEQPVTLRHSNEPLLELLKAIASTCQTQPVIVGSVIYIGPDFTARRLRTVLQLTSEQHHSDRTPSSAASAVTLGLAKKTTQSWRDLESPEDIAARIAQQYGVRQSSEKPLPHDLWPAGVMPSLTADQHLLLILCQFDLSVQWQDGGTKFSLVPFPPSPTVRRDFTLRSGSPAEQFARLKAELPDVELQLQLPGKRLTATGTVEQLEAVDQFLNPQRPATTSTVRTPPKGPTTFTFEVKNARLRSVIDQLHQQAGFEFIFDEKELTDAGVKLDDLIAVKVTNVSADELLHALFDSNRIQFQRQDRKVTLKPAGK